MDDIELLDSSESPATFTSDHVSRTGMPRWLVLLPILLIGAVAYGVIRSGADPVGVTSPTSVSAPTTEQAQESPSTTAAPGFGQRRIRGNEAERLGLIHGSQPFDRTAGPEGDYVIALRAGRDLVVLDSSKELAHRIQLPRSSGNDDLQASTMAVLAEKLVVADGEILRSLSVQGGVDLLLADDMVGFQVDGPRLLVVAETSDLRIRNRKRIELREQGVHAEFFGFPAESFVPDGATVITKGGRLFIELGGQVLAPTSEGLRPIHPGNVVAAGANHAFIRTCDLNDNDQLNCPVVRVETDGVRVLETEVPEAFGIGSYVVSPTGSEVFAINDGTDIQGIVPIDEDGIWGETIGIGNGEITAAAYSADGLTLVTVAGGEVQFWRDATMIGVWTMSDLGEVTEIAIAQ